MDLFNRAIANNKKRPINQYWTPVNYHNFEVSNDECKRSQFGNEYRGKQNWTKSGRQCSSWKYRMTDFDPEMIRSQNFCRNPDNDPGGPWCFVGDDEEREAWEYCGIGWCKDFRYWIL